MIRAEGLSKEYIPGTRALDELDLHVAPGEIYCLLGANGAGKTTALHILLNFLEPTSGTASIGGIDVTRDPLRAKRQISYLPENVTLYGALNGRQNFEFFYELSHGKVPSRAVTDRALTEVSLPAESFGRRVREYSKGMRQKLAIAAALSKNAPAILLDEPLSGLDPEAAATVVELLKTSRKEGRAVLMSTHDIFRAREMADRVGIMLAGRKVVELNRQSLQQQDIEELYLATIRGDRLPPSNDGFPHSSEGALSSEGSWTGESGEATTGVEHGRS